MPSSRRRDGRPGSEFLGGNNADPSDRYVSQQLLPQGLMPVRVQEEAAMEG